MTMAELRDHRVACVRSRLLALRKKGFRVWLSPKDPDPHPDFSIHAVDDETVHFKKGSTPQGPIAIELRKVAEIAVDDVNRIIRIRVLGRIAWDALSELWSFQASQVGRPLHITK